MEYVFNIVVFVVVLGELVFFHEMGRGMRILSGIQPQVFEELRKAGIVAMLGKANVLPDIRAALKRADEVLSE